jgi:hypothetical protein
MYLKYKSDKLQRKEKLYYSYKKRDTVSTTDHSIEGC